MKMIIGLNNNIIAEKIKSKYNELYNVYIIETKEEIIENLNEKQQYLIIVREDIKGDIPFEEFIDKIKEINNLNRIVLIVKQLSKNKKEKLFSKEIFNIIEGNDILFEELIENIENPKMVIYKNKKEVVKNNNIIIVTGSKNSGKTLISKLISEKLSKNKMKKVILIDLDFLYPSLDLYIDCDKNYSLSDLVKDIENNKIKKIESYVSYNRKKSNLQYILSIKSIGIPNDNIIFKLLDYLKNVYDYVIVDTSAIMISKMLNISHSISAQLVYVIQMNLRGIREYNLDTIFLDKEILSNTKIIINKYSTNKGVLKYIKRNIPLEIYGYVKKLIIFNREKSFKFDFLIKYNFNNLLKSIGVIRFENLKMKIVKKILNIKEE